MTWKRESTARAGQPYIKDRADLNNDNKPLREAAALKKMTAKERAEYKRQQQ